MESDFINCLAIDAYERSLQLEPADAFNLSGLACAEFALGNRHRATRHAGRLAYVWAQADPGLKRRAEVDALGLHASAASETPAPEREYRLDLLSELGPLDWQPFPAPELACLDPAGQRVRLQDFRGKNVLLVFYLGDGHPVARPTWADQHGDRSMVGDCGNASS